MLGKSPRMPLSLASAIEAMLGTPPIKGQPLSGGDLSAIFRITLADGRDVVAKQGATASREAVMLEAIRVTGAPAPEVLAADGDWLFLELLRGSSGVRGAWGSLAAALALLHRDDAGTYGWPENHAFGHVEIVNTPGSDWPAFWAEHRLRCHLPHIDPALGRRIEALADRLPNLLPARPHAALLHGDLWGGNVMTEDGRITGLIDPACYHGHREVDVAMLTLFDAPPPAFFAALDLEPGWRERQPIYRLWPLLVHLRLFGNSYAGSVASELATLGF